MCQEEASSAGMQLVAPVTASKMEPGASHRPNTAEWIAGALVFKCGCVSDPDEGHLRLCRQHYLARAR